MFRLFGLFRHPVPHGVRSATHHIHYYPMHSHGSFARDIMHAITYSAVWHFIGELFYSARRYVAGSFSGTELLVCTIVTVVILASAFVIRKRTA